MYDAQTSGGLLMSCPQDRAEQLVKVARAMGAEHTAVVGNVVKRGSKALCIR